ncbi:hypothetical protein [Chondrinema litorale]|uniref:hypothetical protein n=1 Tax=Chondrinema litorale TaxID=2994555 RepID=UPI00254372F3|nr:hypothetical protein [Chondrinema litorale]UZR95505.1 hypothetical protein OQ292_06725 [Chondrinema litorale]
METRSFFSIKLLGFLLLILALQSCNPKLCPLQPTSKGGSGCMVRAQHYHDGELYRGKAWWKWRKQHLRYGEKHKGKDVSKRKIEKRKRGKKPFLYGLFKKKKNKKKKVINTM